MKLVRKYIETKPWFALPALALVLFFIIEILGRQSIIGPFIFIWSQPLGFLANVFIILATLSLSVLFRKRLFAATVISLIWLLFGTVNMILLIFRGSPFTIHDFSVYGAALKVLDRYLSVPVIILCVAALLGLLGLIIWMGVRSPKTEKKMDYRLAVACITSSVALAIGFVVLASVLTDFGSDISKSWEAYKNYGVAYCLTNSSVRSGIEKPDEYNTDVIGNIVDKPTASPTAIPPSTASTNDDGAPNVVFLQLESFLDPNYIKGLDMTENPIPNFTILKEHYTSGFLTVPTLGGGTVNTEFEVLTGMSMADFGLGEYPYRTILLENTCESAAYGLKSLGYATHAIHDHEGTFYDRYKVFANLGFDDFTPLEYMYGVEYNALGWAKDKVLTNTITDAFKSTKERDFVFTIAVQSHGNYPADFEGEKAWVKDSGENTENGYTINYYASQLNEVDAFLGKLVETLSEWDEKTVLVIYGDHLPALGLSSEELENGSVYQTEYIIWSNFSAEKPIPDEDICAYQLYAQVFGMLGYGDTGVLPRYHLTRKDRDDYLEKLQILEYDMIYGDRISLGMENPYLPTDIKMGVSQISISACTVQNGTLAITGEGFNEYSVIYLNGERVETEYVSESELRCTEKVERGDSIVVSQVGVDRIVLGSTTVYICR